VPPFKISASTDKPVCDALSIGKTVAEYAFNTDPVGYPGRLDQLAQASSAIRRAQ
jgi:hypothetical protein